MRSVISVCSILLMFLTAVLSAADYTVPWTATSVTSAVITIQQPASSARVVTGRMVSGSCSVACTITLERDGTAATSAVGSTTFTGSGLNDGTFSGTYTGTGNPAYCAIATSGTPDVFSWGTNAGCDDGATGVAMTGAAQLLSSGVSITFAATTGHTSTDKWSTVVYSTSSPAQPADQSRTPVFTSWFPSNAGTGTVFDRIRLAAAGRFEVSIPYVYIYGNGTGRNLTVRISLDSSGNTQGSLRVSEELR